MRPLIPLLILVLAGCATVTPYQSLKDGQGYTEQKLESTRYRLSFAGNDLTPRHTVENYLLYRAAELTLEQGHDYFVLTRPTTEAQTRYTQTVNAFGHYGRYGWYPQPAVGVAVSAPSIEYEAEAIVLLRSGRKPARQDNAYDAREVKQNLEALIQRPPPPAP